MLQIPDNDLESRRRDQKLDPLTGIVYTKTEYSPDHQDINLDAVGEEEEDGDEEDAEEDEGDANLDDDIPYPVSSRRGEGS